MSPECSMTVWPVCHDTAFWISQKLADLLETTVMRFPIQVCSRTFWISLHGDAYWRHAHAWALAVTCSR